MLELFSIAILLFCIVDGIIDAKRQERIAERMVDLELSVERLSATAERLRRVTKNDTNGK